MAELDPVIAVIRKMELEQDDVALLRLVEELEDAIIASNKVLDYNEESYGWDADESVVDNELSSAWLDAALTANIPDLIHADVIRLTRICDVGTNFVRPFVVSISPVTAVKLVECGMLDLWDSYISLSFLTPAALKAACEIWRHTESFPKEDTYQEYDFAHVVTATRPGVSVADRLDLLNWLADNFSSYQFIQRVLTEAAKDYKGADSEFLRGVIACYARKYQWSDPRQIYHAVGCLCRHKAVEKYHQPFFAIHSPWSPLETDYDMIADWQSGDYRSELNPKWNWARSLRLFALMVAVSDDYLVVVADPTPTNAILKRQKRAAATWIMRYFAIARQLPMELQGLLALVTMDSKCTILTLAPDFALRWALGIWIPPQ